MADGRPLDGPARYPGRAALSSTPAAPAAAWIPLYFEGMSGPGWQGWQLDLGLAEQLQQRGEVQTIDEGREVLWDLREAFRRAREEHAASVDLDLLADDEDQLPLPIFAPRRRGRGRHEHPPPPLEQLLAAVRPCGTRRRKGFLGGVAEASDREVAERLAFIYKHRGRGLSDLDLAYQVEWTEARALTKLFFLQRSPRANYQPSVPPSIARRLPRGDLVRKIVGWLIYADTCRASGITCPAPVWARTLDCSEGGWWDAWGRVERAGFGISMRTFQPREVPCERCDVKILCTRAKRMECPHCGHVQVARARGSIVSLDDNWYGVGPKLAELRAVYLPATQLQLDLHAEAGRTKASVAELRAVAEQRRQVDRDEALRQGRRQAARMKRTHYHRAARRRGEAVVPRGRQFLTLREFCYEVAAGEARMGPLRAQLDGLRASRAASVDSYWRGGARGDEPGWEGWPAFWSLAQARGVAVPILLEGPSTAAVAAQSIEAHVDLPEAQAWLSHFSQELEIPGLSLSINAVKSVDGIPTTLVGCEIKEERAAAGLTAAGALLGRVLPPRGLADDRGAPQGLQGRCTNHARDLGPERPRATAPPTLRSPPPRAQPPPRAASPPVPAARPPPATGPPTAPAGWSPADHQLRQELERLQNPELREHLAGLIWAAQDLPKKAGDW